MDSVLTDLDALPATEADNATTTEADNATTTEAATSTEAATTTDTTTNANEEIAAEIELLKTDLSTNETPVDQIQAKWTTFATKLSTDYPEVSEQINTLSIITASLTTTEEWNAFIDLVSEDIIQLQETTTTEETTNTHTDTKDDLEWLFNHRSSHNNQATW